MAFPIDFHEYPPPNRRTVWLPPAAERAPLRHVPGTEPVPALRVPCSPRRPPARPADRAGGRLVVCAAEQRGRGRRLRVRPAVRGAGAGWAGADGAARRPDPARRTLRRPGDLFLRRDRPPRQPLAIVHGPAW